MILLILLVLVIVVLLMLFLYSACVISSECSREEEKFLNEEDLDDKNKREKDLYTIW